MGEKDDSSKVDEDKGFFIELDWEYPKEPQDDYDTFTCNDQFKNQENLGEKLRVK